jgi:hypothetical protein
MLMEYLDPMRTKIARISVYELEFGLLPFLRAKGDGTAAIQTSFGKVIVSHFQLRGRYLLAGSQIPRRCCWFQSMIRSSLRGGI